MKRIHFIGIGGGSVSAACGIAFKLGYIVSGCETIQEFKHNSLTKELEAIGVPILFERDVQHLDNCDLVCVSPAVFDLHPEHPEVAYARQRGIPLMITEEFVAKELLKGKKVITISGTKGKSTTTAMAATFLEFSGKDPTAYVGAKIPEWNKNYRVGESDLFVIEADEYYNKLRLYNPLYAIITNIDYDHPDYFPRKDDYINEFLAFAKKVNPEGILIINTDSEACRRLITEIGNVAFKILKYGKNEEADIRLIEIKYNESNCEFNFKYKNQIYSNKMLLYGEHNVLNALAVFGLGIQCGIDPNQFSQFIPRFGGISRRLEFKGEYNGAVLFDDYAHHPMAIEQVLKTARLKYQNKKIWAVFQPHTYSRTSTLLDQFAASFGNADKIIILPIYASREAGSEWESKVSHKDLVEKIKLFKSKVANDNVMSVESIDEAVQILKNNLDENCVVINMGAATNVEVIKKLIE